MKALILANTGKEHFAEGRCMPTCFLPVHGGLTIIRRIFSLLSVSGFALDDICVCFGSGGMWEDRKVQESIEELRVKKIFTSGKEILNERMFDDSFFNNEDLLVVDGSEMIDLAIFTRLLRYKKKDVLVIRDLLCPDEKEKLITINDDVITEISDSKTARYPWVGYAGVCKLSNDFLKKLNEKLVVPLSLLDAIGMMLGGSNLKAVNYDDLGYGIIRRGHSNELIGGSYSKLNYRLVVRKEAEGDGREKLINDFERIKDLDFDEFVLHVPDDKSNANIQITEEYLSLLYQVTGYKKKGLPLVTGYSCHAGIHPDIVETIPKNSKLITELISRAGNVENDYVESKHSTGEIVCINCGTGMNHNVLLPDGTIVLCCMDYALEHVLGNLLEKSYEEILDSPEAKRIQKEMQKDEVDILCRNCTNARSVQELYEDYHLYLDWCRKLQKSENLKDYDLLKYREWVDNLNDAKEKEQKTYQQWVDNLQKQESELKEQICHLETAYEERIKELKDYQQWVRNLQTQESRLKENLKNAETNLSDLKKTLSTLKESYHELAVEKENLLKELETIQSWKGYRLFSKLNRK